MNIIQTLWTSKQSLLNQPFGWLSPQHHLMAWALSSSKTREFYKELHLYTDSQGNFMFGEYPVTVQIVIFHYFWGDTDNFAHLLK
ncbi:DUF6734 family protein [Arachidicoccus sp.]|uniref:DUF6734 family protein n=1 Tax=Arachidicoccus sp. TaxID=1872624 RepID=UPI003D20E9E7